jgi:hypothetical protein
VVEKDAPVGDGGAVAKVLPRWAAGNCGVKEEGAAIDCWAAAEAMAV